MPIYFILANSKMLVKRYRAPLRKNVKEQHLSISKSHKEIMKSLKKSKLKLKMSRIKKIHFIGIGGIGVSALAGYFLKKGYLVSGSDLVENEITKALEKLGAKIFIGKHKAKNLPKDVDLVIHTLAIDKKNVELRKAKKLKIKTLSYPQALGEITKKHFTIAICGSHGKSTTAAILGLLLIKGGLDPTVILGTTLKEFGNLNFRVGKGKYLVIEADEYKEAFLNYWPKIIVLLNMEYDHPDYFKNLKHYILAFKKFIFQLPEDGVLIANRDDKNVFKTFSKFKNKIWFSLSDKEVKKIKENLKIPGEFNVLNALSVLKIAKILKIPDKIFFKVLSQFRGSWRRLEIKKAKINNLKFILVNDYGHHPTQIRETLKAIREKFPKNKIILIYQPHQYQRTYYLWKDFLRVFKKSLFDFSIITDVYEVAGRENKKIFKKANSKKLVKEIDKKNVIYLPKEGILEFLKNNLKGEEVVVLMGAGNIYDLSKYLT